MKRDPLTMGMMIGVPLMQLLLFGFAINTTPHHLPTAVLTGENGDASRAIVAALSNTDFFDIRHTVTDAEDTDKLLQSGEVLFVVEIPRNFERDLRRGASPSLLVTTDATDPLASSSALGVLSGMVTSSIAGLLHVQDWPPQVPPFTIVQHRRYNPAGKSTYYIFPDCLARF